MSKAKNTPAAASISAVPYPAGKQSGPDDFQAKQDMMTLVAANKIKADKGRHTAAKAHAKKMQAHLSKIASEPTIKGPPAGMTSGDGADGDMGVSD
jgi:hypothetical protein